jgi:hypothetical protein
MGERYWQYKRYYADLELTGQSDNRRTSRPTEIR